MTRYITPCEPPVFSGWYVRLWPNEQERPVVLRVTHEGMVSYFDETTRFSWDRLPDGALLIGPIRPEAVVPEASAEDLQRRKQLWGY